MTLQIGDAAPTLSLPNYTGASVEISSLWRERPLVLVFVRHAGCPLCRAHSAELRDEHDQFEAAGANVALVAMGNPSQVSQFREFNHLPFECLADEKQIAYKAYGIPRGKISQIAGPSVWLAGFQSIWKHGAGAIIGDKYQLPGTVIVDTLGKVRFVYHSRDSSDWPTNEALLNALAAIKNANGVGV
jgi:peroxiredoxin